MTVETLERELVNDLVQVQERFADEKFCAELYRAIARTKLSKSDAAEGHVVLSYSQAEGVVNELRRRIGYGELTLAQTGDEGDVDSTIRNELGSRGWRFAPAPTGDNDPQHDASSEQPPPDDHGTPRAAGSGSARRASRPTARSGARPPEPTRPALACTPWPPRSTSRRSPAR